MARPVKGKCPRRDAIAGFLVFASLAALALTGASSLAAASVTIGQLAPGASPPLVCNIGPADRLQPVVGSGNSYVVPGTGTITSWSTNAGAGPDQSLTMKIFRKVGDPAFYRAVGHDGPRPLSGGLVNSFPTNIAVQAGDVLGLNNADATTHPNACLFDADVVGDLLFRAGDLNDGQEAGFNVSSFAGRRNNVTSVFNPSNTFSVGNTTLNKKKGTATITFDVPNPGDLNASGKGVKAASAAVTNKAVSVGQAQLLIKAKGKKKRKLNEAGKVKLSVAVTYTPTGGDPATQKLKLKLKKKV